MKKLPDRPDAGQLRTQAKELKRALTEGELEAKQRVLESHPKFAGRPAERMEGWGFTLRDAQVTVAREYGFESWKDLMGEVEGERVERWQRTNRWSGAVERSMSLAHRLGHRWVMGEHLLLQLLTPSEPTVAAEVLTELGVTHDDVLEGLNRIMLQIEDEDQGTRSTPVFHIVSSFAQGLAVAMGSKTVTDEHSLLALVYTDTSLDRYLLTDLDPDDVVDGLKARGVPVPRLAPPLLDPPIGPWGPFVYYPVADQPAIHEILSDRFPPGTVVWTMSRSQWKDGYQYVHGEDDIPMEAIVKGSVKDPAAVEVVPFHEAIEKETPTRRQVRRGG